MLHPAPTGVQPGAAPGTSTYQSDQSMDPGHIASEAWDWLKGKGNDLVHALTPAAPDLSGVRAAQDRAFGLQDTLGNERANFAGNYNPANEADIRARQTGGLDMLGAAAAGTVPSVAELQLRQQAARNAAGAYGTAAALQGRSPGAALRSAQGAGVQVQGQTNADAAILRAKEMADARNAYIQALSGVRTGDQNLLGYDTDWRKTLLSGQLGALGAGTTAAGNEATAATNAAGAKNSFLGGLVNAGGGLLAAL